MGPMGYLIDGYYPNISGCNHGEFDVNHKDGTQSGIQHLY